jgi:hypothetical protein
VNVPLISDMSYILSVSKKAAKTKESVPSCPSW